jgi:lipoprotein-anchoring transpeptidase ErfK/SrfK
MMNGIRTWVLALALAAAMPALPAAADTSAAAIQTADAAVRQARADMLAAFGQAPLRNGQHRWKEGRAGSPVSRVVLDLSRQLAFAYSDDELIAVSTLSSGDKEHLSPLGVFPILEKKRHHRSIKYDNAPMPWMQRINEYGVALHGGHLPGYPASHGCIRLPNAFAAKLFAATRIGTEVVIGEPDGPPAGNA